LNSRRLAVLDADKSNPWEILNQVNYILQNCKHFGTVPFSRLARIAFIAKSLLISLKKKKIISQSQYDSILFSVKTVAGDFLRDLADCNGGKFDRNQFLSKYGHLRSGTYDITSP